MNYVKFLFFFFFLFTVPAKSLPKCETGKLPVEWNNCIGNILLPDEKWEKGRDYTGEFRNGKPNGNGTAIWPDDPANNKYEGKWKDGKRHGKGTQSISEGYRFVGIWINDSMKGKGTLFYPESIQKEFNYKSVEGTLDNYDFNGKALATYMNGTKVSLEYEDGTVIKAGQWYSVKSEDEFEDKKQIYFYSSKIPPNIPLSFPYKDSDPFVGIGCEKRGEKDWCWVYMKFKALNMTDGAIQDGYMDHTIRVKLESGKIENFTVKNKTGSDVVHFHNDLKINEYMRENKELLIEFNHYGDGKRHYKIDTLGFDVIMDSNFDQYWMRTR
jgi:hypothetical protein|tara:strand:- start:65 stop:1042 length:978 start_codon:yes stop_codon:yes gene_type:complete